MVDSKLLVCFENPQPNRDYVIEHVAEEFTSLCPKTGHPDFGSITIRFCPDRLCVELKSLKLYLQAYRTEGVFYESLTNLICDDLVQAMQPRWLVVRSDWRGRGGIHSHITATYGDVPQAMTK